MEDITFVFPFETTSISLTGNKCALHCKHCNKRYLIPMTSLNKFDGRAKSVLISGGCDGDGVVPILKFKEEIKKIKEDHRVVAHTGLLPPEDADEISELADVVSFDFIGDDDTIKEVYALEKTVNDFSNSFIALDKHVRTVPHITIGLQAGKILGERNAMELLESLGAKTIVFNVLIPTKGTCYELIGPPEIKEVLKILKEGKDMFSNVYLGCMRPGGRYRRLLDSVAIDIVDRIVMPSRDAIKKVGEYHRSMECCVL